MQAIPPPSPKDTLPTMYDLPSEDPEESGLPDDFHWLQPQILRETFLPPGYPTEQIYIGSDLNVYYDPRHPLWHKRPDWFAVLGVPRLYEQRDLRLSYVVWQEGVNPFIVVELLSPGTEKEDLGQTLRVVEQPRIVEQPPVKWEVYESILRIPYYVVYDRYTYDLRVFQLTGGHYTVLSLDESRFWIAELQLGLGLWQGQYRGIEGLWLRWYDAAGNWILTPAEQGIQQAEQERQRAEQEAQRAEQERQRAERLIAQLRALGVEPELE